MPDSINVDATLNSGQVFLWKKFGDKWYGIDGEDVLAIEEKPFRIRSFQRKKVDFFREGDNLKKILNEISKDKVVKSAVNQYKGLRLMRQDPFQCYISFIVSSNSNIQNIKQRLNRLCIKFGKKISFDGIEFFLFPDSKTLSKASKQELQECSLGYRAEYVKEAANLVTSGIIDFENLKKKNYQNAKESLLQVFGIGNKVADCILLFSLDKLDSFPLDTWMIKILKKYYSKKFLLNGKTISEKKYNTLHNDIVNYFGQYAGYSQQFLFKMERDLNQKKWL